MSTLRQQVSDIRGRHKLLAYDNLISDRLIASELRSTAFVLLKRETNLRRLWSTDTIFTTIPCLEMTPVPLAECCDYTSNEKISRSKYQLPKIAEGNYQYLISGVYNIEGKKSLSYMPIHRYINYLKLEHQLNTIFYWIQNKYLYCSDSRIKKLRVSAFFETDIPTELLSPECDCKGSGVGPCINPLDMEFNLPGYLADNVKDIVSKKLMETYFRNIEDKTSDDNEPD